MSEAVGAIAEPPYWDAAARNGWRYLLPPLSARRALFLYAGESRSRLVAQRCLDATMVWDEQIPELQHASRVRDETTRWRSVDELLAQASLPFDAVILHDPEGRLICRRTWGRILRLLSHLRTAMPADSFIYVGMQHALSVQRAVAWIAARRAGRSGDKVRHLLSVQHVMHDLTRAGFDGTRSHPYIMWGDTLAEVVPANGYRASKNRESRRERIKEVLFGPIGKRFLAPAYGIVATSGALPLSIIELFEQRLMATRPTKLDITQRPDQLQHLLLPGDKAIVGVKFPDDEAGAIGVFVGNELAIERRRAESSLLQKLASLPEPLARLIPRVLDQWSVGETTVFVMSRRPGVSLDIPVAALDEVTRNALEFLVDLHRASASPCPMDTPSLASRIGVLLAAAAARNPPLANDLQSLYEPLQACLNGMDIPTVWQHGDYKVENVLYDQHTHALTGVIDWELATQNGLPLLDLLYLLIYNRMIRGEEGMRALRAVLLEQRFTTFETACVERYMRAIGIPAAAWLPLCAVFLVDHIGHRLHLSADPPLYKQLGGLISDLRIALHASTCEPRRPMPARPVSGAGM